MQLIQVISLALIVLGSAGFLQDPTQSKQDPPSKESMEPKDKESMERKEPMEPNDKESMEPKDKESVESKTKESKKREPTNTEPVEAQTKESKKQGVHDSACEPKDQQSMEQFEKAKGRDARQGDCTWRCKNDDNKKAWCKFSKYDASTKTCSYFPCVPKDEQPGGTSAADAVQSMNARKEAAQLAGTSAVLVAARNLTSAVHIAHAKLDINQKVYIENAPVLGDGAGQGSLNACRGFAKQHVSNPDAPEVKVCGTGIKLTAYLRGECQEYYEHVKIIGKCDTKMPSDTCDSYSPADDARFGAYQSYKIEPC